MGENTVIKSSMFKTRRVDSKLNSSYVKKKKIQARVDLINFKWLSKSKPDLTLKKIIKTIFF